MNRFKLALRLTVCIGCLTLLVLVGGQFTGVIPTGAEASRAHRLALCEGLAVHSAIAAADDDVEAIEQMVRVMSERNSDVVYASVERHGIEILEVGSAEAGGRRGSISVKVPVLAGDSEWGSVQVVFDPHARATATWLDQLWQDPTTGPVLYFATVGQAAVFLYCFWLAGRFQSSAPLPQRVRDTLDSFAEGILVLNRDRQVAYANSAFCATAGRTADDIQGGAAADLGWSDDALLPWEQLGADHKARGTLVLTGSGQGERSLSVRAVEIADDRGQVHGSLATFDDLTTVEEMNRRLTRLLEMLKQSQARVEEQNRELERLATRDPLTDCLNRRSFYDRFRPLFAAARRHGQGLGCMMVDIDHFKSINDQHGHAMGDEVLRQVSAKLQETARAEDLVCRFGGEEFCLILPHTDIDGTRSVAERCRASIAALQFDELSVTASFGITELSLGASTEELLLEQADQALYVAKRSGRDRVVSFDDAEMARAGV